MTNYNYIVVSDTNNVVDYIFASNKYKFIRGASLLLDYLNTNKAREVIVQHEGRLLSSGGGEARVLFMSEEQAIAYAKDLQQLYIEYTDEVTLSLAVVARKEQESIATWIERAEQQLRLAEMMVGKKQLYTTPLLPIMKRCETCYRRVAERFEQTAQLHVCGSCHKKLNQFQAVAKQVQDDEQEASYSGLSEVHELLAKRQQKTWIQSIDQLFGDDATTSKIGFVYADGKNIGSLFKQVVQNDQLEDEAFITQYMALSKGIHDSLIHAAARTHEKLEQLNCKDIHIDYALIGGDDLAAVMPAHIAFLYTYYLLQYFEEETAKRIQAHRSLAAGIVIAKHNYPIHTLFDLSYELMDRTKSQHDVGTLDFQVILDSNVQSIKFKRSESPVEGSNRYLYAEGYSVDQGPQSFTALYKTAYKLKKAGFPSSKIKGIYQLTTEQNEQTLQFLWKEWKSRLPKEARDTLEKWQPPLRETPFCLERDRKLYTPIRDLFDLYDFVDVEVEL